MDQFFKLLASMFKRVTTAVTMPFRMIMVRVQKLFNVNIISAKLIKPLTGGVKKLFKLKPTDKSDYVSIFGLWVYKKLIGFLVLAACAFVFIYFTTMAPKVQAAPQQLSTITTDVTYDYDDIGLREYSGVANIRDHSGSIVFTGEIAGGECSGYGTLYTRDGTLLYQGAFANNQYNGAGTRYYPNGQVEYEGEFSDNLYSGAGRLYTAGGVLLYEGTFAAGQYDGTGKLWDDAAVLLYEGEFTAGLRHGVGKQYFADGKLNYEGDFFENKFQGVGVLYATSGQRLFAGKMYAGRIDYLALLNGTLADATAAFAETPTIFYQNDNNACFLYEKAGVILTTDCRVRVYEWVRETDGDTAGQWYLPGVDTGLLGQAALAAAERPPAASSNAVLAAPAGYLSSSTGGSASSSSSSSSSSEASSSSASASSSSSASSTAPGPSFDDMPEFVDNQKLLYFEIDKGMWESEADADKSKIFIKSVTVLDGTMPGLENAAVLQDDPPPSIEDCIAIDTLRQTMPTAFPNVHFEIDKRNKLFQRIWNINYADSIDRRSYTMNDVIYRVSYLTSEKVSPVYVTIQR